MYAVDALSDAIDVTREFLTPVRAGTWLKLAVVVFFITGMGFTGTPTAPSGGGVEYEVDETVQLGDPTTGEQVDLGLTEGELLTIVLVVVGIGLFIWLVLALIGAIMEFVFVESLRTGETRVRRYSARHVGRALRLFGFRVAIALFAAVVVAIPSYAFLWPIDGIEDVSTGDLGTVLFVAVFGFLVYALVMRLTTEFVVPVMIHEERPVLSAWRRFWPTLTGNLAEYVVYVLLATIISFIASIAITIVWGFALFLLLIPFVILVVLFFFLGPVGVVLLFALAIVFAVAAVLLMSLLHLPLVAYVRYYALLLLGDTNRELDLIPEQRAAVRAGSDWEDDHDGSGGWDDDRGWNDDDRGRADDDRGWDADDDDDDRGGWR